LKSASDALKDASKDAQTIRAADYVLLPEWAEQEAVALAWPHRNTDWQDNLNAVQATYLTLIDAINACDVPVLLLCPANEVPSVEALLNTPRYHSNLQIAKQIIRQMVMIIPCDYNDTWVRDYVFLTVSDNEFNYPANFQFNGWGEKFDAHLDNRVNDRLVELCQKPVVSYDFVLEGGAVEIDENQHLLTTSSCLLNPKRNGNKSTQEYEALFKNTLGAKRVTILQNGRLQGDDTDGHIDTLVRFTPLMGIVVQGANNRPQDPHFDALKRLENELITALPVHQLYSLPLPLIENNRGERLPASYANFLILNRNILLPIYGTLEDHNAISVIKRAYPNYEVYPINCLSLVQQGGSLHCSCMQVPEDTIKQHLSIQARSGVTVYD